MAEPALANAALPGYTPRHSGDVINVGRPVMASLASVMKVVFFNPKGESTRWQRALRWLAFLALLGGVGAALAGTVVYGLYADDIPDFHTIDDYRPKTVSQVYDQSGQLIGEFYRERRLVLPYDRIPPKLVQAFLASPH